MTREPSESWGRALKEGAQNRITLTAPDFPTIYKTAAGRTRLRTGGFLLAVAAAACLVVPTFLHPTLFETEVLALGRDLIPVQSFPSPEHWGGPSTEGDSPLQQFVAEVLPTDLGSDP